MLTLNNYSVKNVVISVNTRLAGGKNQKENLILSGVNYFKQMKMISSLKMERMNRK